MNESLHPVESDPADTVIGEMELSPRSRAGARTRALAGLTLAVGAFASIAATPIWDTTVSVR